MTTKQLITTAKDYSIQSCIRCKHFYSFQSQLEDPLEDSDYGRCTNESNIDSDNFVGYDKTCNLFEK